MFCLLLCYFLVEKTPQGQRQKLNSMYTCHSILSLAFSFAFTFWNILVCSPHLSSFYLFTKLTSSLFTRVAAPH